MEIINKINKYIGLTVIKSMLLVLLILVGLESFILFATQLNSIGKGSYTVFQAIMYVLLILPQETYQLFPMAALMGVLFGLSLLSNHSELVVMRASGVSPLKILQAVFQAGLILVIFMSIIGEGLGPIGKSLAEKRKLIQTSTEKALKTDEGLWLIQNQNFYHIKTIYSKNHIADISRYEFDQGKLINASFAKDGYYQKNKDSWEMTDVNQSLLSDQSVSSQNIKEAYWNLAIDPHLLRISRSLPQEMSLKQLSDFLVYQHENRLSGSSNEIVFWQRIFQPLASLLMMFLAVPFIFGPLRSANMSLKLLWGIIVGFLFYLFNQLFPPLSEVLNFSPIFAAILPLIIFGIVGIYLMKKIKP
jgi:lipopolysaccharide export system permease protein